MTAPLTDHDLARLADTLAVALLLPADIAITGGLTPLACINCPPGIDRAAIAVMTWRPGSHRAHLLREACCGPCLTDQVPRLAGYHRMTIEIPAVTT